MTSDWGIVSKVDLVTWTYECSTIWIWYVFKMYEASVLEKVTKLKQNLCLNGVNI